MKQQLRHSLRLFIFLLPSLVFGADNQINAQNAAIAGQQNSLNEAMIFGAAMSKSDDKQMQMLLMMMMMQQQSQAAAFKQNQQQNSSSSSKGSSDDKGEQFKVPQPQPSTSKPITPDKPDETTLVTLDGLKSKPVNTDPVTSSVEIPDFVPPQISLGKPADQADGGNPHPGGMSVPGVIAQKKDDSATGLGAFSAAAGGDLAGSGSAARLMGVRDLGQAAANIEKVVNEDTSKGSTRNSAKPEEGSVGGGGGAEGSEPAAKGGGGSSDDFFSMLMKGKEEDPNANPDAQRDVASDGPITPPAAGSIMNIFEIAQLRYRYAAYKERRVAAHSGNH